MESVDYDYSAELRRYAAEIHSVSNLEAKDFAVWCSDNGYEFGDLIAGKSLRAFWITFSIPSILLSMASKFGIYRQQTVKALCACVRVCLAQKVPAIMEVTSLPMLEKVEAWTRGELKAVPWCTVNLHYWVSAQCAYAVTVNSCGCDRATTVDWLEYKSDLWVPMADAVRSVISPFDLRPHG